MVRTRLDLAVLLKFTRAVELDTLSLSKMAERLGGEISKSELGRIMSGDDFPSWGQLSLLLDLFGVAESDRRPWKDMWDRLTAMQLESTVVSPAPTHPVAAPRPIRAETSAVADPPDPVAHHGRLARRVLDEAMTEAELIVSGARRSAEDQRQAIVQDAQATAARILERASDEQAQLVRSAELRIAVAFDTAEERITAALDRAEERLRELVTGLGSSVADTAADVERLVADVRGSVATIRDDLAALHGEADRMRGLHPLSDRYFAVDEAAVPPVLGYTPRPGPWS